MAVLSVLEEMFSYSFIRKAVIVGLLVSLCASLLGVSLVLKRYSMIGDGLSHVGFGALAAATALNLAPLSVAIPVAVLAAFFLLRLSENSVIKGDAGIALISTASLALGVVIISQTTGMNTDVCNYLFGSILAMTKADVYLSVTLSAGVLILFVLFYHKIFAVTFDETFAKATGLKTGMYTMLIAALTAITIVLGLRMMGSLLISALIIFPALTSMRLCKRFKTVTICSAVISVSCFFAGVVISFLYAIPTGASIVMVNIGVFCFFGFVKLLKQNRKFAMILLVFALPLGGCENRKANTKIAAGLVVAPPQGEQKPPLLGTAKKANSADLIEIKEKMFLAQTNEIYLNPEEYLGKTLKLEGLFQTQTDYTLKGNPYYFVVRKGPGCCPGLDSSSAGFEVLWENPEQPYPNPDDWVEAVGVLSQYEEDGYQYLCLSLSSLNVLEVRGAEYVTQ
ncbi:MAG: metal ABC transporter permease [Spirochaetaceae bacterium]|jgi:zinc transport system permease protein|nr:metal ABC transporter permease [Spirochaetaceae bacterium]